MMGRGKKIEPSLCLGGEFAHGDTLYVGVYLGSSTAFGVKCLLDKFPRTYGIQTQRHWFIVGS